MNKKEFCKCCFLGALVAPLIPLFAGDTTWDPAVEIASSAISVDEASIAINDSDRGLIIWANANEGGSTRIECSSLTGGAWTAPTPVSDWCTYAGEGKVSFNNAGQGAAVWLQYDGSDYAIAVSNYSDSTWSTPHILATSSIGMDFPQIAINASGSVATVWQFNDGYSTSIGGATYSSSGGWSEASVLSVNLGAVAPQIAISDMGNALATWTASDGTYMRSEYSAYTSSWSAPTFFPCSGHNAIEPRAATNALGNAVISWRASDIETGMNMIGAAKYTFGVGCSNGRTISDPGTASFTADLAINDLGNAIATWLFSSDGGATYQIGAWYLNGETWSAPATLTEAEENNEPPVVALNNNNKAVSLWISGDGVEEATFDTDAWGPATEVSATAAENWSPDLSINNTGHVFASWTYYDDATGVSRILVSKGTLP